jgi:hypothetical protein
MRYVNLCEPHCASEDEVAAGPYQVATGNLNSFIASLYLQTHYCWKIHLLTKLVLFAISVCYTL